MKRRGGLRLIAAPTTDEIDANAFLTNNQAIHIKNNSWGPPDDAADLYGIEPLSEAAFATGTQTGRGGHGTIYVFAGATVWKQRQRQQQRLLQLDLYDSGRSDKRSGLQAFYSTLAPRSSSARRRSISFIQVRALPRRI